MKKRYWVFLLFGLSISSVNAEESGTYVGFDLSNMSISFPESNTTPQFDHVERMFRARIGVMIMPDLFPGLAVESHLALGMTGEDVEWTVVEPVSGTQDTLNAEMELETVLGLYLRGDFYSADDTSLYGLLGMATAQSGPRKSRRAVDQNGTPVYKEFTEPETEYSVSMGLGFTYAFSRTSSLQLEYMNVVRKDEEAGFDVSGFSAGVNFSLD